MRPGVPTRGVHTFWETCPYAKKVEAPWCYQEASRIRRRPTLPHAFACSTIGSGGLNDRVRDGIGCDPSDIATESGRRCSRSPDWRTRLAACGFQQEGVSHAARKGRCAAEANGSENECLVSFELMLRASNSRSVLEIGQASRPISTGQLRTLLRFHTLPITT